MNVAKRNNVERSAMQLRWFPVNNAYAFTFGHDIGTMQVIALADERRFFELRVEAVAAARRHKLNVDKSGNVNAVE
jgi:hypothetical protein